MAVSSLDLRMDWYVPLAYMLICLGFKWLCVVLEARSYPEVECLKDPCFESTFYQVGPVWKRQHVGSPFLEWIFVFPMFAIFELCWGRANVWLALFLCCSFGTGFLARLTSVRRALKAPGQSLARMITLDLLLREGFVWFRWTFLVPLMLLVYPYSSFVLLGLIVISSRLPSSTTAWLLMKFGYCSEPTQEVLAMVESASLALEIPSPTCVVAEVPVVTAFARPLEGLIVISRAGLDALDRPEYRQAILDHEVAHVADLKDLWHSRWMGQCVWLGAVLTALTILTHCSIVPSWPLSETPVLIASVLVLLLGVVGLLRNLLVSPPTVHGLLESKELLKRLHALSEQREEFADTFAQSRVGKDVYGEALTEFVKAMGVELDARHQFGYPSLAKRVGASDTDETAVVKEIEALEAPTIGLLPLLRLLAIGFAGLLVILVCCVGPLTIIAGPSLVTVYPDSKGIPISAFLKVRQGFTEQALFQLDAPAYEKDLTFWQLKLALFRQSGDDEGEQKARERILEISKGHLPLGEGAHRYLEGLRTSGRSL